MTQYRGYKIPAGMNSEMEDKFKARIDAKLQKEAEARPVISQAAHDHLTGLIARGVAIKTQIEHERRMSFNTVH
jgi:hypothetical protein